MQPIPKRGGLTRDDDLREIIRETLTRRGVTPNKRLIEDIYILCIKVAANTQYQELRRIVTDAMDRLEVK